MAGHNVSFRAMHEVLVVAFGARSAPSVATLHAHLDARGCSARTLLDRARAQVCSTLACVAGDDVFLGGSVVQRHATASATSGIAEATSKSERSVHGCCATSTGTVVAGGSGTSRRCASGAGGSRRWRLRARRTPVTRRRSKTRSAESRRALPAGAARCSCDALGVVGRRLRGVRMSRRPRSHGTTSARSDLMAAAIWGQGWSASTPAGATRQVGSHSGPLGRVVA